MTNITNDSYDNLECFCNFFGPDWKSTFGDYSGALNSFFKSSNQQRLKAVQSEIEQFLKEFQQDEQMDDALLELGCVYNPIYRGLTLRAWLGEVKRDIERRLTSLNAPGVIPKDGPKPPTASTDPNKPKTGLGSNIRPEVHQVRIEPKQSYSVGSSGPSLRVVMYILVFILLAICVESRDMQAFLTRIFGH